MISVFTLPSHLVIVGLTVESVALGRLSNPFCDGASVLYMCCLVQYTLGNQPVELLKSVALATEELNLKFLFNFN